MFCTECGTGNAPHAKFCVQCGHPFNQPAPQDKDEPLQGLASDMEPIEKYTFSDEFRLIRYFDKLEKGLPLLYKDATGRKDPNPFMYSWKNNLVTMLSLFFAALFCIALLFYCISRGLGSEIYLLSIIAVTCLLLIPSYNNSRIKALREKVAEIASEYGRQDLLNDLST